MLNYNYLIFDKIRQGMQSPTCGLYSKVNARLISKIERELYVGLDSAVTYGFFELVMKQHQNEKAKRHERILSI